MTKISPSILAADFVNLETDIKKIESAADMLHIDVMDGHFVPNISIGVPVVQSIRKCTDLFLDTHLMISRPQDYIEAFAKAGSDLICFHYEADCSVMETIELIRSFGIQAAVALKPGTPANKVLPFIKFLDMVLIMTVEPGFGGQAFMPETVSKITEIRQYANEVNPNLDIQVDGGINGETARIAVDAGANVLVAGSYVFGSDSPAQMVQQLSRM